MKYKITEDEFKTLTESMQKEYHLSGGVALLKIEGDDAPTAEKIATLEKKRDIEIEHRKNAEAKVREADDRATQLQKDLEGAGGNKDAIEKLKKEHSESIEKMRLEREAETKQITETRNASMVKEAAQEFASKHFVEAPYGSTFVASEISKRMSVEEVGGVPVVRVVNADGTPSTASLGDLQKEFLDNKDFSPIIKANVGSGGGASQTIGGGATRKNLSEMNATEEAAFEKESPEEYATAVKELEA